MCIGSTWRLTGVIHLHCELQCTLGKKTGWVDKWVSRKTHMNSNITGVFPVVFWLMTVCRLQYSSWTKGAPSFRFVVIILLCSLFSSLLFNLKNIPHVSYNRVMACSCSTHFRDDWLAVSLFPLIGEVNISTDYVTDPPPPIGPIFQKPHIFWTSWHRKALVRRKHQEKIHFVQPVSAAPSCEICPTNLFSISLCSLQRRRCHFRPDKQTFKRI